MNYLYIFYNYLTIFFKIQIFLFQLETKDEHVDVVGIGSDHPHRMDHELNIDVPSRTSSGLLNTTWNMNRSQTVWSDSRWQPRFVHFEPASKICRQKCDVIFLCPTVNWTYHWLQMKVWCHFFCVWLSTLTYHWLQMIVWCHILLTVDSTYH